MFMYKKYLFELDGKFITITIDKSKFVLDCGSWDIAVESFYEMFFDCYM